MPLAAHPTQECDDGGNIDGDGCNFECIVEYCGDYVRRGACACLAVVPLAVLHPALACVRAGSRAAPPPALVPVPVPVCMRVCGLGLPQTTNNGEACDGESDCRADCTAYAVCGNFETETGEVGGRAICPLVS